MGHRFDPSDGEDRKGVGSCWGSHEELEGAWGRTSVVGVKWMLGDRVVEVSGPCTIGIGHKLPCRTSFHLLQSQQDVLDFGLERTTSWLLSSSVKISA